MSELFTQLGINWMLLLAQIINFAILAFVLSKFLYKPIMKMLDDRKNRIAEDLEKSKTLEMKIVEAGTAKEDLLAEARRQGEKMIKQSEKNASEIKEAMVKEAGVEVGKMRDDAKRSLETDRQKTMDELKKELGSLVSLSVEKALGDVADKSVQEKIVEVYESLKEKGAVKKKATVSYFGDIHKTKIKDSLADYEVEFEEDKNLVGGIRIQIGDLRIDNTIAGRLVEVKKVLAK